MAARIVDAAAAAVRMRAATSGNSNISANALRLRKEGLAVSQNHLFQISSYTAWRNYCYENSLCRIGPGVDGCGLWIDLFCLGRGGDRATIGQSGSLPYVGSHGAGRHAAVVGYAGAAGPRSGALSRHRHPA